MPQHAREDSLQYPVSERQSAAADFVHTATYVQAPKKRKVWPWVLGAVLTVVLLLVGACVAIVVAYRSFDRHKPIVAGSSSTSPPPGPGFSGKRDTDTAVRAGDSVTIDRVTIRSSPLRRVSGEYENDQTYLCTEVVITNNSDKSATFSMWDWKLQNPRGTIRDSTIFGSTNILDSGELVPGGSNAGDVCFDNQPVSGTFVVLLNLMRLSSDRIGWVNEV